MAPLDFCNLSADELLRRMETPESGLTTQQVNERRPRKRREYAPWQRDLLLLLSQFKNPLVLLLVVSLLLSSILGELGNSLIIFVVLFLTGILGFIQERNAGKAMERLRNLVKVRANVLREGKTSSVPLDDVVAGDIVQLEAGDIIPGDGLILRARDLYVNEAVLTGESFPAEKSVSAAPGSKMNAVFSGTNVISGQAEIVLAAVGEETELGRIGREMGVIVTETAFEKGIRRFGRLIIRISLVLAGIVLAYNLAAGKPAEESFLFALAISVGLAPELLPSIITITLSAGAKRMAEKKVVVKRLASIQNLGAIDVLCSDKTGTLTEGEVRIHAYLGADGTADPQVGLYAYLNAKFETGFLNPLDEAIRRDEQKEAARFQKLDEVPYDFIRKRLSIVVTENDAHMMISKGSFKNVLEICTHIRLRDGKVIPLQEEPLDALYHQYSGEGYRVLGIAYKDVTDDPVITKDDEQGMIFLGFILLADPLKPGIRETIGRVQHLGISLKLITGDNRLIAHRIATELSIDPEKILTGEELHRMNDEALVRSVAEVSIFAETEPSQKERIVRALQQSGSTVGYLGDGINDASALKTADVGITVENAVDVARDAADMILLEKDLQVLCGGVEEGRKTYLNTLKYIFITTSANFGNMASMAIASVMLPFLPLLPLQVLLVNFLTDIPSLAIASDNVDAAMLDQPRKWNMKLIRNFMIVFGLQSSVFDFLTFGMLYLFFRTSQEQFRTGWFIESVITEVLILFVIRTRLSFLRSRPGKLLAAVSLLVLAATLLLPFLPFAGWFSLVPLDPKVLGCVLLIALVYLFTGELTKRFLFRRLKF